MTNRKLNYALFLALFFLLPSIAWAGGEKPEEKPAPENPAANEDEATRHAPAEDKPNERGENHNQTGTIERGSPGDAVFRPPHQGRSVETDSDVKIWVSGYLRSRYSHVMDDPNETDFVGRYDGFQMANARLRFKGKSKDFWFMLSLDGAVDRRDSVNTSTGETIVRLKDAYVSWRPHDAFHLTTGQIRTPFDAYDMTSTSELLFIERPLSSRGVKGVEGYNVEGLGTGREVGLGIDSEPLQLGSLPVKFTYSLAVTNGNHANASLNDNDALALYGRLEMYVGDWLSLGGSVYTNELTHNEPPDELTEDRFGYSADIMLRTKNILLIGQYIQVQSKFGDVSTEPERVARGYTAALAYHLPYGLIPGYRLAYYDPTAEFKTNDPTLNEQLLADELMYHTIGLAWVAPSSPFKLQLNYTVAQEPGGAVRVANDRADVVVQYRF